MKTEFTPQAARDYKKLSRPLQERVDKQMAALRQNLRHPSLKAKKYHEQRDVWQGRVNRDYRFYFQIIGDTCDILMIVAHPK